MSTFKRNENIKSKEESFKTFFGHQHLDAILQNNLLKGQLLTIEEDQPTTIHMQLLRYLIGSAYHTNQTSIIHDIKPEKWRALVPLTSQKKPQAVQIQESQQFNQNPSIAWRYQSMQMELKLTNINQNIPHLDLSKAVANPDELLLKLHSLEKVNTYKDLLQNITDSYQQSLKSSTDAQPKKLLIKNIFHPFMQLDQDNIYQFLQGLKVFTRSSHCLTVLSVPPNQKYKEIIMKLSDFYISINQIFQNNLFKDFQGILQLEKVGTAGFYKQISIDMDKWGIKINNKELEIEQLYETAVDEDDDQETNKNKQKEQLLCSSKPQDKGKLDF